MFDRTPSTSLASQPFRLGVQDPPATLAKEGCATGRNFITFVAVACLFQIPTYVVGELALSRHLTSSQTSECSSSWQSCMRRLSALSTTHTMASVLSK